MEKVFVFDFDGTIVDSNHIKQGAWPDVFTRDDVKKNFLGVLKDHLFDSRYEIIRLVLEKSGIESTTEKINFFADKYNDIVEGAVINAPYINGVEELLNYLNRYPLYVVSNTPEPSMRKIVTARDMKMFKGVYGSPDKKVDNIKKIIELEGVVPAEVMVVGDGDSDLEAAKFLGCGFTGLANEINDWVADDKVVFSNLEDILRLFKNRF